MMWSKALAWLGFSDQGHDHPHGHGDHRHGHGDHASAHGHGHTHGVVDPVLATTERGIWAIKWSFVMLGVTAALQLGVVILSGSVALLADTIHNVGDAATAVPLWVAFLRELRRQRIASPPHTELFLLIFSQVTRSYGSGRPFVALPTPWEKHRTVPGTLWGHRRSRTSALYAI